jgi:hypothetical protein
MDLPLSEDYTPVTSNSQSGNELPEGVTTNAELRQAFERMYARQQQMEAELASARAALYGSQPAQQPPVPEPSPPAEVPMNDLIRTLLETLNGTSQARSGGELARPREWKPPSWDGRAETFRDYLSRMRSSYRVRSQMKPKLPDEYYWEAIYNTLPARECSRMRHFWEKGHPTKGKDPEAFFAQLEEVFADTNEQAKALEQLTLMKHANGQPWH